MLESSASMSVRCSRSLKSSAPPGLSIAFTWRMRLWRSSELLAFVFRGDVRGGRCCCPRRCCGGAAAAAPAAAAAAAFGPPWRGRLGPACGPERTLTLGRTHGWSLSASAACAFRGDVRRRRCCGGAAAAAPAAAAAAAFGPPWRGRLGPERTLISSRTHGWSLSASAACASTLSRPERALRGGEGAREGRGRETRTHQGTSLDPTVCPAPGWPGCRHWPHPRPAQHSALFAPCPRCPAAATTPSQQRRPCPAMSGTCVPTSSVFAPDLQELVHPLLPPLLPLGPPLLSLAAPSASCAAPSHPPRAHLLPPPVLMLPPLLASRPLVAVSYGPTSQCRGGGGGRASKQRVAPPPAAAPRASTLRVARPPTPLLLASPLRPVVAASAAVASPLLGAPAGLSGAAAGWART
jgi:hypothetical protein